MTAPLRRLVPLALAVCLIAAAYAQAPDEPRFDVVSIKPNRTATGEVSSRMQPPRYTGVGVTAMRLVRMGFLDVTDRIEGGPAWLETERFDVQASWSGPSEDTRLRAMMRRLVTDGFTLKSRLEMREVSAYALVAARSDRQLGPRLKVSPIQNCIGQAPAAGPDGQAVAPRCGMRGGNGPNGGTALIGLSATMDRLARELGPLAGRPVVDRTTLNGAFEFELEFASPRAADSPLPSLFTALQEQLGLKLESTTAPVRVLVIEGAERPSMD
jgi:uncharacterized protein (TIGR03435 family)